MKKIEFFKVEGDKINRFRKHCPKCGPGIFLGEHKDRFTCGSCGYTEFKSGGRKEPKPQPIEEKAVEVPTTPEQPSESSEEVKPEETQEEVTPVEPSQQSETQSETPIEEPPTEDKPEEPTKEPEQTEPEKPVDEEPEKKAETSETDSEKTEKKESSEETKD